MQVNNVTGTVITYNPDLSLLKDNLAAAVPQVSGVLIYDNGSSNVADIRELLSAFPSVELIENGENLGLPVNYNKAARKTGDDNGNSWLLILDQDTVLPEGYVQAASAFFGQEDISIISCPYWDSNAEPFEKFQKKIPSEDATYIQMCISSGSLCRIRDILNLGGFDEQMFIDYVDYDYCQTVAEHGLKVLQLNRYCMEHHIGNTRRVSFFGKSFYVGNHSAFRKYHIIRNIVYYIRKHKADIRNSGWVYKSGIKVAVKTLIGEDDKWNKLRAMLKGFADGFRMKLE